MRYSKYSGRGNFFSLPNEIFQLGLNAGELSVYCFLRRCENHRTHQCWPSIRTIGEAVGMSENTVRKYIRQLEERGFVTTEPTEVITTSAPTVPGCSSLLPSNPTWTDVWGSWRTGCPRSHSNRRWSRTW